MAKSTKVHLALFLVALIYAATFSIAKEVMPYYIKPMGLITIRVWGAVSLLWVTHALFVKESIFGKKDFLMLLKCAVFGVAANMLLFFKGLAITTPINAAILMVTTPLFVAFFSFFLLNEKATKLKIIGLCFGVIGAVLLLVGPSLSFNSSTLWGDLMVMSNAIIYAYYLIIAKPLLHKYTPITVIKWTFFFGGLLVIPFGFADLKEVQWDLIPNTIWSAILFLIVGATYITYVLNAWALRNANSTLVGAYIYLQPVLATIIAVAIGKDTLTLPKALFSLLIFIGVYLVGMPSAAKTSEK